MWDSSKNFNRRDVIDRINEALEATQWILDCPTRMMEDDWGLKKTLEKLLEAKMWATIQRTQ